jgi:hypothetical protein
VNIVLTSFLTSQEDPQRGEKILADKALIQPLIDSCKNNGVKIVVLNDCFEESYSDDIDFVSVAPGYNPYFYRWELQREYLESHPEVENVYLVDATDVEMQFDPFYDGVKPGHVYVGDECEEVGCDWMLDNSSGEVHKWVVQHKNYLLLNCGVVGGDSETIKAICFTILNINNIFDPNAKVEMPIFNMVLRTYYGDRIIRGRQITTLFKSYKNDDRAFFKHK